MNHKQTVIDGKIVYANRFLRWGEAIWDFIDDHLIPWRIICWLGEQKRKIRYGFQRMFRGYDETISWGYESSIKFYKKLLSDLIEYSHGHPTNLWEICPVEWDKHVVQKWQPKLKNSDLTKYSFDIEEFSTKEDREEFFEDCFKAWMAYLNKVLNYFNEADSDTCSKNSEKEELYNKLKNPFDEKKRTVVEHNGQYFYQYPSLGDSPEDKAEREILKKLNEIDEYQLEQLKYGMAEVARNIVYLND